MSDEFVLEETPAYDGDNGGKKTEFEAIPDDTVLEAELLGMEKKTMPFQDDDGNDVIRVEWAFKVTQDGDFKNRRVWGQTSTTFTSHEDCKMRAWVQELLAVDELQPGFKFRTNQLIGNKARIVVGTRSYTNKAGEFKTVNTIKDVIRPRSAVQQRPADPKPAPSPEPVGAGVGTEEPF